VNLHRVKAGEACPTVSSMMNAWSHPAALSDEQLLAQCDFSQGRASGPGGQHRNKVETKVTLLHRPTGISAQASERRSMIENKRMALRRLRLRLAVEHRCPVPPGEIGSALWKSRRQVGRDAQGRASGRIVCNPDHHDYPALLAEALDVIDAAGGDIHKAATRLEVTASQLVKLIKDHPPALVKMNMERAARGEHPLR